MKWMGMYLFGYMLLIAAIILSLWKTGVLAKTDPFWIGVGLLVAVGLGIMVSAKTADTAVRRHQLKRWMREVFRLRLKTALAGHDAVVLFRVNPPADARAELERELMTLVPKALAATPQPERRGARRGPAPAQKARR